MVSTNWELFVAGLSHFWLSEQELWFPPEHEKFPSKKYNGGNKWAGDPLVDCVYGGSCVSCPIKLVVFLLYKSLGAGVFCSSPNQNRVVTLLMVLCDTKINCDKKHATSTGTGSVDSHADAHVYHGTYCQWCKLRASQVEVGVYFSWASYCLNSCNGHLFMKKKHNKLLIQLAILRYNQKIIAIRSKMQLFYIFS